MTPAPRPLTGDQLRDVRESSRRQARAMSGIGVALIGALGVALTMLVIVVLDYRFHQPFHRVAKLLGAGALGCSILAFPWTGMLTFPVVVAYLPWIPPIPIPGMNMLNLLLGSVFCSWAVTRILRGQSLARSSTLGGVLGVLLGLIVLGVVRGAAFPAGGEYDLMKGVVVMVRAITEILIFYITLSMARGGNARRQLVVAILLGLALECFTTITMGRSGKGDRAVGSIGQSNELGTYMAIYGVLAAAMIPAVKNVLGKIVLAALVAAAGFGVILSLSRAGMIAIAVGLLYVGMRSSRVLTAILLVVFMSAPLWAPDYLKDRITGTTVETDDSDQAELDNASQLRVSTWQALFRVIGDHPLDGVGFNALPSVLPASGAELGMDVMDSSHNTFLRMQGELGILGLGIFIWVLWKCWALSTLALRAARTTFDRQLAVGLGAGTLALAISCGFGDRFFNVMICGGFWILCALAEDILHERRAAVPAAAPVPPVRVAPAGAVS